MCERYCPDVSEFLLQLGFDSLFFARIDYQDRAKRLNDKSLEIVWRGSKSLASSSQVRAGHDVYILLPIQSVWLENLLHVLCILLWWYFMYSFDSCCKLHMQIFTGIFPRHYDPPDGFTFEINDVSPPIQVKLFVVKNIHINPEFLL